MRYILKLITILSLAGIVVSCNMGGNPSNAVSIDGPFGPNLIKPSVCNFSNSTTSCSIALSYEANPAASLSIPGVTAPYSVTYNNCTRAASEADCTVIISYTESTISNHQTASFTVDGFAAPNTISLTNQ